MSLEIFIDGACRGNPGPSSVGVVIFDAQGKELKRIKEYLGEGTNNLAEYKAFICALNEARSLGDKELKIKTDSRLLVNQLNGAYKVKNENIKVLYFESLRLIKNFRKVEVLHIDREKNKIADKLANEALDAAKINPNKTKGAAVFDNGKDFPESLFENQRD